MVHPIYRQGDMLLTQVADLDMSALDPATKDARGLVLAEGKSSGHFHAVYGSGAKLFRFRDTNGLQALVTGKRGAEVRVVGGDGGGVPRHEPITIAPGKYVIRTQRSWTSAHMSRQVAD